MTGRKTFLAAAGLCLVASTALGIELGILDDFEGPSCLTDDWFEGPGSPNPPFAAPGCGFAGSCCLVNESAGGFGPGSRQATLNEGQWTGDYLAAGVNKIELQIENPDDQPLHVRAGITNGTTCYVSSEPISLPAFAPPAPHFFLLDESVMTTVPGNLCGGSDTFDAVISNVIQLRIISASEPNWSGDAIASAIYLDAIQSRSDQDLDGINDESDNCRLVHNPDQRDTNGDGYGNICDQDLNDDCSVNIADLAALRAVFFSSDPDADFNGDGRVNIADLALMKRNFFGEPGPGTGSCDACEPPAPIGGNADFGGFEMFVRGGVVLDWGAVVGVNSFSDGGAGTYTARFEAAPGTYEYKVADADWTIEYCTPTPQTVGVTNNLPFAGCSFPVNGTIEIPATGCYEFRLETDGAVPPASVDLTFDVVSP